MDTNEKRGRRPIKGERMTQAEYSRRHRSKLRRQRAPRADELQYVVYNAVLVAWGGLDEDDRERIFEGVRLAADLYDLDPARAEGKLRSLLEA